MARRMERRAGAWSSASSARAGSATSGCSRRWARSRARSSCPSGMRDARLRGRSAADRPRADDLAALGRRRDLRGARAARRRGGARGRRRARATRRRSSRAARRAACVSIEIVEELASAGARDPRPSSATRTSRCWSATAAARSPSRSRTTRSRSTRRRPRCPAPLARALRPGGRLVIPIAEGARATCWSPSGARTTDAATSRELERREIAPCRFVPLARRGRFPGSRGADRLPAGDRASSPSTSSRRRSSTSSSVAARRPRSGSATRPASTRPARSSGSPSATSTRRARRSSPP